MATAYGIPMDTCFWSCWEPVMVLAHVISFVYTQEESNSDGLVVRSMSGECIY